MGGAETELAEAANRLYWTSETSVNRIADDLGLSKGTLYSLIEPEETGVPCPECGTGLSYANRTARDKAIAECPECGLETDGSDTSDYVPSTDLTGPDDPDGDSATRMPAMDGRFVAGAALLVVAAGLIIVGLTRRR